MYTVKDPSGMPVAGVVVDLTPLKADGTTGFFYGSTHVAGPFTAVSDVDGMVRFENVPPNAEASDPLSSYRVDVGGRSVDGYRSTSAFYVVVPADQGEAHDLTDITVARPSRVGGDASGRSMTNLISVGRADVGRIRESTRLRRLLRIGIVLAVVFGYIVYRDAIGSPLGLPHLGPSALNWLPAILLILLLAGVLVIPMLASGRSPHILIRPEHIDVGLSDVQGLDGQVEEVIRSLNVFLGYATFKDVLGGNPRRGILFEGPPGTGKTYLAKAMAKQAGVPFMFVSAPAFQSMFYGMTAVRIRAFFKALRKAARRSGGAIGFIEEIDAIGAARGSASFAPMPDGVDGHAATRAGRSIDRTFSEGTSGVVNELLIQMQSFDQPPFRRRVLGKLTEWLNGYLPDGRAIKSGKPTYHNILLIAATNRSDAMDPALLRPGRFDRRLYFDLPTKSARRDLIDYFLERKAHDEKLDKEIERDRVAHDTFGYTPVMIEHLFDEALLLALRDRRGAMTVSDIYEAKITEETGLKQVVAYGEDERRAIATHEAGHATAAFLLGTTRRLEILSIIKRQSALGLLAHSDTEERYTRPRSELEALIAIALGGMAAEELFLHETTTGPGADLAGATSAAATMVGALAMGDSLISYEAVEEGFVGRRNLVGRVLADREGKQQVEAILADQKERVTATLDANRDIVEALRDALIDRDELVRDEILDVIHQALARRAPDVLVLPEAAAPLVELEAPIDPRP